MKKVLSFLLVVVFVLVFCSCGNSPKEINSIDDLCSLIGEKIEVNPYYNNPNAELVSSDNSYYAYKYTDKCAMNAGLSKKPVSVIFTTNNNIISEIELIYGFNADVVYEEIENWIEEKDDKGYAGSIETNMFGYETSIESNSGKSYKIKVSNDSIGGLIIKIS